MALLQIEGLNVELGGQDILRDVTFALEPGAFCGLIGANGSGKTTLLRTILGFVTPVAGRVRREGAVGYVPQRLSIDPDMPVRARDFVELGLNGQRLGLPFPSARRRARVDEMLCRVGADKFADQRAGKLSGGQLQRVMIAHALISRPKLLLLDEPLANLDLRAGAEIITLLRNICTAENIAVLISAHDMNPLLGAMDRIVYLANGKAASGPAEAVVRTEILSALYGYHIDVLRVHGRIIVVAGDGRARAHEEHVATIP